MVKITLKYGDNEEKLLVPEQKPVRDILKEAEFGFSPEDRLFIGDRLLHEDDLDKNLLELGYTDSAELTIRVEHDLPWETDETDSSDGPIQGSVVYPPKARIIGCACIIFSAFTPDELRDFQRYLPDALTRRDENGEPVFAIALDEKSPGSLTKYGAVFSRKTTSHGNATITILIDPEIDDMEESVRDSIGSAIISLVDMEEYLMTRMSDLAKKKALLDEYISAG